MRRDIFIADYGNSRVREVNISTGVITTVAGGGTQGLDDGGQATAAQLGQPRGVAVDTSGHLFIADRGAWPIREVNLTTGVITTVAGQGQLDYRRCGVAVDTSGHLFIADTGDG